SYVILTHPLPTPTPFPYTTLFRSEARQWLPRDPKPGDKHPLPPELVSRLTRLHLVDTVNGQTSPFSPGQVTGSQIATQVVGRERSEEHTSELQSRFDLVCRLLLEK